MPPNKIIALEYANDATRRADRERIPVPDGYLGHQASPEEMERLGQASHEGLTLGIVGWVAIALIPMATILAVLWVVGSALSP